ncbi:hypothetical protein NM208_g12309 [Fusarium decemcellulare]|uniref:Uncharacterized protein n=1 Tax=Fusarium decemcellulare TaxID=57161 RepID=A0ACC1RP57_9HYPO|nr:hypothetical protein NM208_g12309 [Fusarium decemcellulare]
MSKNGDPITVPSGSAGLAHYPHARLAPPTHSRVLYISGTSSRLPDGSFAGVKTNEDGTLELDIRQQTLAIFGNIDAVIKRASGNKGGIQNIIDATVFLTDLKSDYAGMNAVWNEFWPEAEKAPARTTIGVKELPSPKLVVEVKCTALIDTE